jgi:hypothetical protein
LERDAQSLEATAFQINCEDKIEARGLVELAAKLRRAAQAIRDGRIEGVPVR